MTLSAKYQAFLASPTSGALAEQASLHYITTLTTINDASAIIKHLAVQDKLLKKKEHKVLSAIEGSGAALCVELEITIEFVSGGGAYLPGLDDNFVADRTVTFPMVHVVHFKGDKITQIRQHWDQGSLLKQIEVIGARARSWPIRDGKDQIRLIASSAANTSQPDSAGSSRPSTASRAEDDVSVRGRSSRRGANNAMNDPHASLSLFENRQPEEAGDFEPHPIASRVQSAKPPPRNLGDLFVGEDPGTPSPNNKSGIPTKAGSGKNFKPNRLFDEEEEAVPTPASIKTHAKKYQHFDFDDGENDDTPKIRERNPKHNSQWGFEDFATPEKTKTRILAGNVRHFDYGNEDLEEPDSPVHREIVHKPRRDADTHFEFKDDGTPDPNQLRLPTAKGRQHNDGLGLYKDHVTGGESSHDFNTPKGDHKGPLNDITHIKNDIREKDFGAHWEMKDDSPGVKKVAENASKLTQNQQKVLKTMDANWGNYEPSPEQQKIRIAGNGMGGRSTTPQWNLFDEDPELAKKENAGIKSMGNGMGGRKGTDFNWDF